MGERWINKIYEMHNRMKGERKNLEEEVSQIGEQMNLDEAMETTQQCRDQDQQQEGGPL